MTFLKVAPTWNQGSRRLQPAPNLFVFALFLFAFSINLRASRNQPGIDGGKYVGAEGLVGYYSSSLKEMPLGYGLKDVRYGASDAEYFTDFFPVFVSGKDIETIPAVYSGGRWEPNDSLERGYLSPGRIYEKSLLKHARGVEVTQTVSSFGQGIFFVWKFKNTSGSGQRLSVHFTGKAKEGITVKPEKNTGLVFSGGFTELFLMFSGKVEQSGMKLPFEQEEKDIFRYRADISVDGGKEQVLTAVLSSGKQDSVFTEEDLFSNSDLYWETAFSELTGNIQDEEISLLAESSISDIVSAVPYIVQSELKALEITPFTEYEMLLMAVNLNRTGKTEQAAELFRIVEKGIVSGLSSGVMPEKKAAALFPFFIYEYFLAAGTWIGDYADCSKIISNALKEIPLTGADAAEIGLLLNGLVSFQKISLLRGEEGIKDYENTLISVQKTLNSMFDRSVSAYMNVAGKAFSYSPEVLLPFALRQSVSREALSTAVWIKSNMLYGAGVLSGRSPQKYGADARSTALFADYLSNFPDEPARDYLRWIYLNATCFLGIPPALPEGTLKRNDLLAQSMLVSAALGFFENMNRDYRGNNHYSSVRKMQRSAKGVRNLLTELLNMGMISEDGFTALDRDLVNLEGALLNLNEMLSAAEEEKNENVLNVYALAVKRAEALAAGISAVLEPRYSGAVNYETDKIREQAAKAVNYLADLVVETETEKIEAAGGDRVILRFSAENRSGLLFSDVRFKVESIPGTHIPEFEKKLKEVFKPGEKIEDRCEFIIPPEISSDLSSILLATINADYKGFRVSAGKTIPVKILKPFTYQVEKDEGGVTLVIKSNIKKMVEDISITMPDGWAKVISFARPLAPGGIIHCVIKPPASETGGTVNAELKAGEDIYHLKIDIKR